MANNAILVYNIPMPSRPDIDRLCTLPGEDMLVALQQEAALRKISDIHLSPEKDAVRLQWRELGILVPLFTIPHSTYDTLQRRIKFNAKLKLNVTNTAQDGQYTFDAQGRVINVRVSCVPSRFGEALTLRFLDPKRGIVPLEKLGFPDAVRTQLTSLVSQPNGLILVTGPTGSGKTTTLYALLASLNDGQNNIITLEDPIEYELPGVVQTQVDTDHGYTFAQGLRSILRHDPDIILVGEIRDTETAQTAIDASLTGHLVIATLHTNSAIEAIPRLLSMGVSPHTFAPALRGVLAQRLVRTLTPACSRDSAHCDPHAQESYGEQSVVAELLVATPAIRDLILKQASEKDIDATARKEAFRTMREWGEDMVRRHVTTAEEIARVAS